MDLFLQGTVMFSKDRTFVGGRVPLKYSLGSFGQMIENEDRVPLKHSLGSFGRMTENESPAREMLRQ
jgi:hypothetical protein